MSSNARKRDQDWEGWLRAYDIENGRELWRGPLPESGKATPMSYQVRSGEQFVVIAVGGGDVFGTGDYVVAFRLSTSGQVNVPDDR